MITISEMQILTTNEYGLFKRLDGNRNVNELHKKRLMESLKRNYLFTFIIVNENYEIIDGQHRFECISEMGLPLNYVICDDYGLNEVQILNANSKNWTPDDYMQGYIDLGYDEYIKYSEFKEKYKLTHSNACSILNLGDGGGNMTIAFKNGEFKIKDLDASILFVDKLLEIKPYYENVFRRTFVATMRQLLNNVNFDYNVFISKLKLQSTTLRDCTNIENYIKLIEDIYNFKNRNKINLRF